MAIMPSTADTARLGSGEGFSRSPRPGYAPIMGGDDRATHRPMACHLETERLVLSPLDATDAELYAELINKRGPGARGFGTTVQGANDNLAKLANEAEESGLGLLAVRRRTEGDFIGYCGLIVGRASIDEPEIAFELFRRAHGQGYATEAAVGHH